MRTLRFGGHFRVGHHTVEVNITFREHVPVGKSISPSGLLAHRSQNKPCAGQNDAYGHEDSHDYDKSNGCRHGSSDGRGLLIADQSLVDQCPLQGWFFLSRSNLTGKGFTSAILSLPLRDVCSQSL